MSIFDKDLIERSLPLLNAWKVNKNYSHGIEGIDDDFFEYILQDVYTDIFDYDPIKNRYVIKDDLVNKTKQSIVKRFREYYKYDSEYEYFERMVDVTLGEGSLQSKNYHIFNFVISIYIVDDYNTTYLDDDDISVWLELKMI